MSSNKAREASSRTKFLALKSDLYLSAMSFGRNHGICATAFAFLVMSREMNFFVLSSVSSSSVIMTSKLACNSVAAVESAEVSPLHLELGGCSW